MRFTRRNDILQAAAVLIRREGFDTVKLAHIAHKAGVHRTIVYRMFNTVDEVLLALVEDPLYVVRHTDWSRMGSRNAILSFVHLLDGASTWFVVLAASRGMQVDDKPIQDILDEIFCFQLQRFVGRENVDVTTAQYHLQAIMGMILRGASGDIVGVAMPQLERLRN